jgi:hypothetical protein
MFALSRHAIQSNRKLARGKNSAAKNVRFPLSLRPRARECGPAGLNLLTVGANVQASCGGSGSSVSQSRQAQRCVSQVCPWKKNVHLRRSSCDPHTGQMFVMRWASAASRSVIMASERGLSLCLASDVMGGGLIDPFKLIFCT